MSKQIKEKMKEADQMGEFVMNLPIVIRIMVYYRCSYSADMNCYINLEIQWYVV